MLSDATAASFPLEIDGVNYLISPLTYQDFSELINFAGSIKINKAEAIAKNCSPEMAEKIRNQAVDFALNMSEVDLLDDQKASAMLSDREVVVYMIYLSLRHRHSDITREKAKELSDSKAHLLTIVEKISGLTRESFDGSSDGSKKK